MCFEDLAEEVNYFLVPLLLSHLFFITHLQKKLEVETSCGRLQVRVHLINSWEWTIQAHSLFCSVLLILASSSFSLFPTERNQFTLLPHPPTTKRSTDSSCLVGNLWKQERTYFLHIRRDLNQAGANSFSLERIRLRGKLANSCELLVRRWSPALSTCQLGRCSSAGWLVPVVGGDQASSSSSSPVVRPPCILRQAKEQRQTQDISEY